MSNTKNKFRRKLLAMALSVMMLIAMVPTAALTSALGFGNPALDYLSAQDFTAAYVAEDDSVVVSWTAIAGALDSLSLTVADKKVALEIDADSYTFAADAYAGKTVDIALTAALGEEQRTVNASVAVPATLTGVKPMTMNVENHLSLSDIQAKLPSEALVSVEGETNLYRVSVVWSADSVNYNRDSAEKQTIRINGQVTLPDTIRNRNELSLNTYIDVTVGAAVNVSLTTDLTAQVLNKEAGAPLSLAVKAQGTVVSYQWYHNGSAIKGANAPALKIDKLMVEDAGSYYCVVTGKNGSAVTSQTVTVNVSKKDTSVSLSVNPVEGQTRPSGIKLQATGLPADAEGTLTFKAGDEVVGTATLPNTTVTFYASGVANEYSFSVEYSGNAYRYNGSTSEAVNYSFGKGSIYASTVDKMDGVAGSYAQVTPPTATLWPTPEFPVDVQYVYSVSDESVASVDQNGRLTYKKAGDFELYIAISAGDDYNDITLTVRVNVTKAANKDLAFSKISDTVTFRSGFSYAVPFTNGTYGDGALTVAATLNGKESEYISATIDGQHVIITYDVDTSDADLPEGLAGAIEVVLTKEDDGAYDAITSAPFTLNIVKGQQLPIYFSSAMLPLVYSADKDGKPLTVGGQQAMGDLAENPNFVNSKIVYSTEDDCIRLDAATGEFVALKPGNATITATKPGNSLLESVSCTYKVRITQGQVVGLTFEDQEISSPYGKPFTSPAPVGGQANAGGAVTYTIYKNDPAIQEYFSINKNTGEIAFNGHFWLADNPQNGVGYEVTIAATKADCDLYQSVTVYYDLLLTRDAVSEGDYTLDGAAPDKDGSILSNFGNLNKDKKGITILPAGGYTEIWTEGKQWSDSLLLTTEGAYEITFCLRNAETGKYSQPITKAVVLDKRGPKAEISMEKNYFLDKDDSIHSMWSGFTSALSFDLFKESSKKVTVETLDILSDISEIYYYVQTDGFVSLDKAEVTMEDIQAIVKDFDWNKCDNFEIPAVHEGKVEFDIDLPEGTNAKVVVYVKVVDAANNVSYFRTDGVVFDTLAPTYQDPALPDSIINITLPKVEDQAGLYNSDVPFDVTVTDPATDGIASGIQKVVVTVSGLGSYEGEEYLKVITATAKYSGIREFHSADAGLKDFAKHFTVDNTFIIPKEFNSNHLTITVEVWDYAGNYCSNMDNPTRVAVDSRRPEIEVSYEDSGLYFSNTKYLGNGQHRTAVITVTELNFDPAKVDFSRILLDGKKLNVKPQFVCIASDIHGDGIKWQAYIDFEADGDYTFNISCTDKAQNKNAGWLGDDVSLNKYWTIDNTKPTIHVTMSNSNVSNNKYFAAQRVATITITERNFSKDYYFDWSEITYYLDGVKMTAPQARLLKSNDDTYERVYTIAFSADGDYTFGVSYTDLADNVSDDYTCYAVSHKAFTVDKSAPTISISGVEDQTAYNDYVAPIVTYADLNGDMSTLSVSLTGVKNGAVAYTRVDTPITYGKKLVYDNFNRTKAVDDIYTLSVSLTDMAGNTSSKKVSFSVNRFGSTYDLSAVKDILGQYLREGQDIVFTETNVDPLNHETLLIKVIKNGTPTALVEGVDYALEQTGGEGKWSVYKYTISKDLFATDGNYSVVAYSEDAAGNVNENDDETKKAEINFAIDNTAPVIIPSDFESDTPYGVDTKKVSLEIKDNLRLDAVKILLNGEEVEYTVEGDSYLFDISKSNNKQNVKVVAVDAAGNSLPVEVKNVLVNANFFVRWYNNTTLFIGSLVGVALLILVLTALALFGKKRVKR